MLTDNVTISYHSIILKFQENTLKIYGNANVLEKQFLAVQVQNITFFISRPDTWASYMKIPVSHP